MGTGFDVVVIWLVMALLALITPLIVLSAVWALWRMTWAHEKIERHVAEIERLMAARASGVAT